MTLSFRDSWHDESGQEIATDWEVIKFTDEDIVSLSQNYGLLFATTQSGIIWVSSDKGQSWRLQSEILEELATHYERSLEDLAEDYSRKILDIEVNYLREKKKILND